jgi:hypothetical protein
MVARYDDKDVWAVALRFLQGFIYTKLDFAAQMLHLWFDEQSRIVTMITSWNDN